MVYGKTMAKHETKGNGRRQYKIEVHDSYKGWVDTEERFNQQKVANDRAKSLSEGNGRVYRVLRASKNGR